jgi:myo-inositol-1(or 4)-monophosphatase
LGSATLHLSYVAAGLLTGVVGHNVKVWDVAAAGALWAAGRVKVCFLDGDLFPLREFDVKMGGVRHVAGHPTVCSRLRTIVEGETSPTNRGHRGR